MDVTPSGVNHTRTSASIPRRLAREGAWHLLPIYALLRLSDLCREGMEHSGSWRFADHLYRGRASGRWFIGVCIDAIALRLPASRSFRQRCAFVRDEVVRLAQSAAPSPLRVASIPSGVPRDLMLAAQRLDAGLLEVTAVDIDPEAFRAAAVVAGVEPGDTFSVGPSVFRSRTADALTERPFDDGPFDVIACTGFGEFLTDEELVTFLTRCHRHLDPGGTLLITATGPDRFATFVLDRIMELRATYRTRQHIERLVRRAGFTDVQARDVGNGRQTFLAARVVPE